MAVCLVMQFSGMDAPKYDAVMEQLGLMGENPDFAPGFISHVVGFQGEVANVVDVWESQQHFERFVEERLRPAFDVLGIASEARIDGFEVYNTMRPRS